MSLSLDYTDALESVFVNTVSRDNWLKNKSSVCEHCDQRRHTFCAAVPLNALDELVAAREEFDFAARETLFEQGEPADHIFIVTDGYAKIYSLLPDGRCIVHGFMHPGDYLGLAVNGRYAYFAAALTPMTVCRFKTKRLEELNNRYPDMQRRILNSATNELVLAQDRMMTLGRKTALAKAASFLVMMRDKQGGSRENGDRIYLPMSRADIADYLGLTTETISRTLSCLIADGIISKNGDREVICHQPQALINLVENG